jgi:hypothetical protein
MVAELCNVLATTVRRNTYSNYRIRFLHVVFIQVSVVQRVIYVRPGCLPSHALFYNAKTQFIIILCNFQSLLRLLHKESAQTQNG